MFFNDQVATEIKERLADLVHPVKLVVFWQALQFPESEEVKRLIEELATLDSKLSVEAKNFVIDEDRAKELKMHHIPGIAVLRTGEDGAPDIDYGVRFFGLPMQYDFSVLLDAVIDVSKGESGLEPATLEALQALETPVHLQVFTTPTCPFCPRAARLAYKFAIASEKITADGVEVTGFPDLSRRYRVSSVPKTVVGENGEFIGAQGEGTLLEHVLRAGASPVVS